jgi:hypothetical protein
MTIHDDEFVTAQVRYAILMNYIFQQKNMTPRDHTLISNELGSLSSSYKDIVLIPQLYNEDQLNVFRSVLTPILDLTPLNQNHLSAQQRYLIDAALRKLMDKYVAQASPEVKQQFFKNPSDEKKQASAPIASFKKK